MTEDIILIDERGRHHCHAPAGFDWAVYPGLLCVEEVTYAYVGTTEGTPHYRVLVADAGRVRAD
jgi:hypothetical protein